MEYITKELHTDTDNLYSLYKDDYSEKSLLDIYKTADDSNGMLEFDVPNWGIKDFINERNYWIKGTNLTHGNEPGWFYFKVFFKFNTGYGLFGGLFIDNHTATYKEIKTDRVNINELTFEEEAESDVIIIPEANSAKSYLTSLSKLHQYKHLKLEDRLAALKFFASMLFNTSIKTPWMIKGINNLQNSLNVNLNNFSEEKSFDLLFNTETTDFRLSSLFDLYKYACYDDINCKEIIPENLRKFDMTVIIYHMPIKYIQTGISVLNYGPLMKTMDLIEQAAAVVEKFYPNSGTNLGVNVVNSISGVVKALASESSLFDYKTLLPYYNGNIDFSNMMSYKMLTFQNCEIDISSFGKYLENVEIKNETPFQFGSSALKIKYDRVYYHNSNEWNQFLFGSDGFYYNVNKNFNTEFESSKNKSFKDIFKKDDKKSTTSTVWDARINALSQIHDYAGNSSALSPDQWKPLLDYSDIAIHDSLRDFDMEDLVVPDKAISFDLKSGNIYENFTKVKSDDVIMNAILKGGDQDNNVFNKSKYFLDKLEQLKATNNIGNIFGNLCTSANYTATISEKSGGKFWKTTGQIAQGLGMLPTSSEMNTLFKITDTKRTVQYNDVDTSIPTDHISKYYDQKLSKLQTESTSDLLYKENILAGIINDALNIYNETASSKLELLSSRKNNLENKNLYGDFGPKTLNKDQFSDVKTLYGETLLSNINVDNTTELNSILISGNDYFSSKISYIATEGNIKQTSITGNIYGGDFITYAYSASMRNITDYFTKKIQTLLLNAYQTPVQTENDETIFETRNYNNFGSLYLNDFGLTGKTSFPEQRMATPFYTNKMSRLATEGGNIDTSKIKGNIYHYDMSMYSYNGERAYTEAFAKKMNRLKDSYTLIGNIYDYDLGYGSSLFETKMGYLATESSYTTTTLIDNIYHYDMSMYSYNGERVYTEAFAKKINKLKDAYTLIGNIYDYDLDATSELFKTKMGYLATESGYTTTTLIDNIYHYDMAMYSYNGKRAYTEAFAKKINKLKDAYTLIGNIYDYDLDAASELFKTKMGYLATESGYTTTTLIDNIYHYDMSISGDYNNRAITERFSNKINSIINSNTLTGNIYDYDLDAASELFKTKMGYLATESGYTTTTLIDNIYHYDMSISGDYKNRTITERFNNKINSMINPNTLTGNIYDYDLDAASELFKTKMAHLATNSNLSSETLIGNIYSHNMNIDGDIFNRTITGLFGNKMKNLINASSNIGNLYKDYSFKDINNLDITGASPVKLINNQYILTADILPDSDKNEFNEHIIQTIDSSNDYKQNIVSGAKEVEKTSNKYILTKSVLSEDDKNEFNEEVVIFDPDGNIKNANDYKQNIVSGAKQVEKTSNKYVLTQSVLSEDDKNEFKEEVAIFDSEGKIQNANDYKQNIVASGAKQVEKISNKYVLTKSVLSEDDKNEFKEEVAIFDSDGKIQNANDYKQNITVSGVKQVEKKSNKYVLTKSMLSENDKNEFKEEVAIFDPNGEIVTSTLYKEFISQYAHENYMGYSDNKYSYSTTYWYKTELDSKSADNIPWYKKEDSTGNQSETIDSQLADYKSTVNINEGHNYESSQRLRTELFATTNNLTFNEGKQIDEAIDFIKENNENNSWGFIPVNDKKHFTTVQEWASKNVLARLAGNATKLITQATDVIKNVSKTYK